MSSLPFLIVIPWVILFMGHGVTITLIFWEAVPVFPAEPLFYRIHSIIFSPQPQFVSCHLSCLGTGSHCVALAGLGLTVNKAAWNSEVPEFACSELGLKMSTNTPGCES